MLSAPPTKSDAPGTVPLMGINSICANPVLPPPCEGTSVSATLKDHAPRPEGGCRMVKRKCWCSKPNFMVCFPHTFVRLSMYCDVRLVSMDVRDWLLPRVFSPVMKMVPRPPFEGTCGTP